MLVCIGLSEAKLNSKEQSYGIQLCLFICCHREVLLERTVIQHTARSIHMLSSRSASQLSFLLPVAIGPLLFILYMNAYCLLMSLLNYLPMI